MVLTAWYVRHKWRRRARAIARNSMARMRRPSGLELLALRYARGDIDRDEYLQKRDDILGHPAASDSRA
jgi:uncharacterized membrane protein